jgi:mannose-1-phosphate guanylyltransferase
MSGPIYALVMAGGSGTRFWPASRRDRPKQLLALAGGAPLLRATVDRVTPLTGADRILVATGARLLAATRAVVPELGAEQLLVEPVPRNTAPCIGWAATRVARRDPDAVMIALPSDQHVRDAEAFRATLARAVATAAGGVITTIGVRPTRPESGFGYVEAADRADAAGARAVLRFVEKPPREQAEAFVASGRVYWNAGIFVFRVSDMLEAVARHLPALAEGLRAFDRAALDGREEQAVEEGFAALPSVSIDYGVMEKLERIAVVPGDFGWSDVGSWLAAAELASERDPHGNSAPAGSVLVAAERNHVVDARAAGGRAGPRRLVALVGVSDLVVVDTGDALLVVHRDQAQRVRDVVRILEERGEDDLL